MEREGLVDVLGHNTDSAFRVFPESKGVVSESLQREGIKYQVVIPDLRRHLAVRERERERE